MENFTSYFKIQRKIVVLKGIRPKIDHRRLSTKNNSIFSPLKNLKFQSKFQCEHDQISNKCIQKHTSTKNTLKGASKGT